MRKQPTIKDRRIAVRAMRANNIRLKPELLQDSHTVEMIKELWLGNPSQA